MKEGARTPFFALCFNERGRIPFLEAQSFKGARGNVKEFPEESFS
jgi:hypothetical protein